MGHEAAEGHERMEPFGTLAVLSVKPDKTPDGMLKLRPEARFRLHGAATVYKNGGAKKIMVCGGKTNGKDKPSDAQVMKDFLISTYRIPAEDIEMEDESKNTTENLVNISKKIPADMRGKLAIMTDIEHLKRVAILAERLGIDAELIDSGTTIHESGPRRIAALLEKFESSPKYKALEAKEMLNRLILVVDKNDYVHKLYALLTRR